MKFINKVCPEIFNKKGAPMQPFRTVHTPSTRYLLSYHKGHQPIFLGWHIEEYRLEWVSAVTKDKGEIHLSRLFCKFRWQWKYFKVLCRDEGLNCHAKIQHHEWGRWSVSIFLFSRSIYFVFFFLWLLCQDPLHPQIPSPCKASSCFFQKTLHNT